AGASADSGLWSTMATGLLYSGVMFVRTYVGRSLQTLPAAEAAQVLRLCDDLVAMVRWDTLMCNYQFGNASEGIPALIVKAPPNSSHATGLPYLHTSQGICEEVLWPNTDGFYDFNEMMSTLWLAYEFTSGNRVLAPATAAAEPATTITTPKTATTAPTPSLVRAWGAWQSRRFKPNYRFGSYALPSLWPCYVVQFPYYTVHAFNSDPAWLEGFRSMWLADWASYNSSAFQGGDTRYGNGAGTTPDWCSGKTYSADKLESNPNSTGCRMFSSYCTAGYLPNSPALIAGQLLQLLAQGDSVLPLPGEEEANNNNKNKKNNNKNSSNNNNSKQSTKK
ncbi:unnamed protein product, partial [Polarella glacialis]